MRRWTVIGRILAVVVLLGGLGVAGGCATEESAQPRAAASWPEQPESMVFRSSKQRQLARDMARERPRRAGLPWYAWRQDVQRTVDAGLRSPIFERSVTVTVDRQHTHGGRVFDHHHTTTYRRSVREGVRGR